MKNIRSLLLLFAIVSCTDEVTLEKQFLPIKINETSGLEYYNDNFLTHNDSGGEAKIYEFTKEGKIVNEYEILNCGANDDWEDITADDEYVFISNSGNNYGNRKNLSILILDKKNNFECKGQIQFKYKYQENYERRNKHPYDAESIISVDDKLVLFSKDRKDLITELYILPKVPGSYDIEPIYSYNVNSLITGSDYNKSLKLVALVGYDFSGNQFFYKITNFDIDDLNSAEIEKFTIPVGKAQIEAVKIIDESSFWITSEDEGNGLPRLFKFKIN
ncbi:MAG: hypothetical protein VX706_00900 [Bacteroidota bacterium]|nr:hypothetical protein [Bacteroidota bacterium]